MSLESCVYEGTIRHRRVEPVEHELSYRICMVYLDLEQLAETFATSRLWSCDGPALAWFRREDHFGDPTVSLPEAVRDVVAERTGTRPRGPIRLLTHLRYFGYVFNPVSFFYCFDDEGKHVETIVAEVDNTPWNERHLYVLPGSLDSAKSSDRKRYRFPKRFHVSPFMGMDVEYDWRFGTPGQSLHVHMENLEASGRTFDATLLMRRRPLEASSARRLLVRYPLMTVRVVSAIYWNALALWLKRAPVSSHPKNLRERPATES